MCHGCALIRYNNGIQWNLVYGFFSKNKKINKLNAIDGETGYVLQVQTLIAFIVIKSCCVYVRLGLLFKVFFFEFRVLWEEAKAPIGYINININIIITFYEVYFNNAHFI